MKTWLALLMTLSAFGAHAGNWEPDDRLLRAVRQIESRGGISLYGDKGLSLGDFQLGGAAWADVNGWRKSKGYVCYDYRQSVYNKSINRLYAGNYLTLIHDQLHKQFRREPSASEIYAAYNLGLAKFGEQCGFDIRRVNSVTASRCAMITTYVRQRG